MENKDNLLPKVIKSYMIGNRGEAFLEFIMSRHALMHKVVGYKDIGIDYLCEWIIEGKPTRVLFGIQVKTSDIADIRLEHLGRNKKLNGLEIYKFNKIIPSWNITEKTINYWFGFEIPLYLFFVLKDKQNFNCYYQRLTPNLHKKDKNKAIKEIQDYKNNDMYLVNENDSFRAIVKRGKQDGGFSRDLFFDSVRCVYNLGSLNYRNSLEFGLEGWETEGTYVDILGEEDRPYMDKLENTLIKLEKLGVVDIKTNLRKRIIELNELLKNPR